MSYYEGHFTNHDGLPLYEYRWRPDGDPAAVVVLVHGFTEHSGRYASVAQMLTSQGHAVYAADLRGHGKSGGQRVFVDRFELYLDDLEFFLERVRRAEPDRPVFLFGHSMGGTIVALLAIARQPRLDGLILSGAAVRIGVGVFPLLRRLAALVSRLAPRLRIVAMGAGMLSRDPEVVADFRGDPLVFHDRFPVRTGAEILRAGQWIQQSMEDLKLPLLILHGTGDVVTDPTGSHQLHQRAGTTDKTLKLYEGLYHDLLHEPERQQVVADLIAWLAARINGAA